MQAQSEDDTVQTETWNQIISLAQGEAGLALQLHNKAYKLAHNMTVHQAMISDGQSTENSPYSKASLEGGLHDIEEHKSKLKALIEHDLGQLTQLKEENRARPRVLLMIESGERYAQKIEHYAEHHQPNQVTLDAQFNTIKAIAPPAAGVQETAAENINPAA